MLLLEQGHGLSDPQCEEWVNDRLRDLELETLGEGGRGLSGATQDSAGRRQHSARHGGNEFRAVVAWGC
jgi:hypothetical protein